MTTVRQTIENGIQALRSADIENPAVDGRRILQYCLGVDHARLVSRWDEIVDAPTLEAFAVSIECRIRGEPVARIFGRREFYGNSFEIGPAVLDPRPETELLVERTLCDYAHRDAVIFCDVGAGSGAVGISILKAMPRARCVAIDICEQALEIASRNAEAHRLADRWLAVCGDYFCAVPGRFDFIVANPPYIATGNIPLLPREVRQYDPRIALDGGADGMRAYRIILAGAPERLSQGGRLYLEIGAGQEQSCLDIAAGFNWKHVETVADLGATPRVIVLESAGSDGYFDNINNGRRKCLESDREQASFSDARATH